MFQLRNGVAYIEFHHKKRPDGFNDADFILSNAYNQPFVDPSNSRWATAEHYFQCCHFESHPNKEVVQKMAASRLASDLQKIVEQNPLPKELEDLWGQRKHQVMLAIIRKRFCEGPNKKHLLDLGDKTIINVADRDPYWGITLKDKVPGKNLLGQLMSRVRFEIAHELIDASGKPKDAALDQNDLTQIQYGSLQAAWGEVEKKQLSEQEAWTTTFRVDFATPGTNWPMPNKL